MNLLSSINLGSLQLDNRVFMAPLTRCRAVDQNIPNELMAHYYTQRASAGLIISEATQISPMGIGYPCTPGIHTAEQIEGWKKITEAVHAKQGHIFMQLWHVGRISHPDFLGGETPICSSAAQPSGEVYTFEGMKPYVTPRAITEDEITEIVQQYRQAAINAIEAGFDGVEVHGANGYLIDQFLRDGVNSRSDKYGGNIENRARFLFEILESVCDAIGAQKVGLRLSPSGTFNDMTDSDPAEHFSYICRELNRFGLAYVHIIDALEADIRHGANVVSLDRLRDAYHGLMIVNGAYTKDRGDNVIEEGLADAVSFGELFISNPDLPERFRSHAPLQKADPDTFYTQDAVGYTDYPSLQDA